MIDSRIRKFAILVQNFETWDWLAINSHSSIQFSPVQFSSKKSTTRRITEQANSRYKEH